MGENMKRTVMSYIQHTGRDDNWDAEVCLDDGSEFRDRVPGFSVGDEIDVSPSGEVTIPTAEGGTFSFTPTWVRAPMPPANLPGVSVKRELHLRPLAAKRYADHKRQDAWIQGGAWNADGAKPRQAIADAFEAGTLAEAALAGWDFVEHQRRLAGGERPPKSE